jgi:hypothetical protein
VDDRLEFWGRVSAVDGSQQIEVCAEGSLDEAGSIGSLAAAQAFAQGAEEILQGLSDHE